MAISQDNVFSIILLFPDAILLIINLGREDLGSDLKAGLL